MEDREREEGVILKRLKRGMLNGWLVNTGLMNLVTAHPSIWSCCRSSSRVGVEVNGEYLYLLYLTIEQVLWDSGLIIEEPWQTIYVFIKESTGYLGNVRMRINLLINTSFDGLGWKEEEQYPWLWRSIDRCLMYPERIVKMTCFHSILPPIPL